MEDDKTTPLSPLSTNLKLLRTRRGFSVSGLARDSGVSKSTVSELERGQGNPSLDTIWALAKTLNVSLGALFVGEKKNSVVTVRRKEESTLLASEGKTFAAHLLERWNADGEVEVSLIHLSSGATRNSKGNAAGITEKVICLKGTAEVGPLGKTSVLNQHDLIIFKADEPHLYKAIGEEPVELLSIQQYPRLSK